MLQINNILKHLCIYLGNQPLRKHVWQYAEHNNIQREVKRESDPESTTETTTKSCFDREFPDQPTGNRSLVLASLIRRTTKPSTRKHKTRKRTTKKRTTTKPTTKTTTTKTTTTKKPTTGNQTAQENVTLPPPEKPVITINQQLLDELPNDQYANMTMIRNETVIDRINPDNVELTIHLNGKSRKAQKNKDQHDGSENTDEVSGMDAMELMDASRKKNARNKKT